jgi:hypothetical protein
MQACMLVTLYDATRDITLRVDDWGVSYILGPLGEVLLVYEALNYWCRRP